MRRVAPFPPQGPHRVEPVGQTGHDVGNHLRWILQIRIQSYDIVAPGERQPRTDGRVLAHAFAQFDDRYSGVPLVSLQQHTEGVVAATIEDNQQLPATSSAVHRRGQTVGQSRQVLFLVECRHQYGNLGPAGCAVVHARFLTPPSSPGAGRRCQLYQLAHSMATDSGCIWPGDH